MLIYQYQNVIFTFKCTDNHHHHDESGFTVSDLSYKTANTHTQAIHTKSKHHQGNKPQ